MKSIPITTDYNNSLDTVVASIEFMDTPAANFAYELFMQRPEIYTFAPSVVQDVETGKMVLVGVSIVADFRKLKNSEGTARKSGKTD